MGRINCKKIIEHPVNISIYHHSSVFGDKDILIRGVSGGKITKGRIKLESTIQGNLLNMTLTFTNVHCDDKGNLTINISDATEIQITVNVQGWSTCF